MAKIHIGCGKKYLDGWVNVDGFDSCADQMFDFNIAPWNLKSNQFEEAFSHHVIEHVKDVQVFMDEVWRVCLPGAKVVIVAPHFSSVAAHSPFHFHGFNSQSMNYFVGNKERYGVAFFKLRNCRIFWYPQDLDYVNSSFKRWVLWCFSSWLDVLINLNRGFFERIWCFWVGGAFEVHWELEVVK